MVCGEKEMKLGFRIWLLIILLVFSLIAIVGLPPTFLQNGVLITSVESNSTAFNEGLRQGQIITSINGEEINSLEDFTSILSEIYPSEEKIKTIIQTEDDEIILYSNEAPDITVSKITKTNIKLGLDLEGGARALVQAQNHSLTNEELSDLVQVIENRLNVYGITDMQIKPVSDLSGNNFMLIEIAGATPDDLEELVAQQGKFEAKIGNETVFYGGKENGVTSVARSGTNAGIYSCGQSSSEEYVCQFRFAVYLSEEAAQRHADITSKLSINSTSQGEYLSKKLDLYLDDQLVDSLLISEGLKGQVTTQISISGSGSGSTQEDAYNDAIEQMNKLQTILITGSLPFKLEIVKLDTISPTLGHDFIKYILLAGVVALLAVGIIIYFRYRNIKYTAALLFTSFSEIVIILGVASFIKWNLDLAGIAGILATIGTGLDDLIVVLDESKFSTDISLKQRIKRAFAIILGAYFTSLVSLLPLLWAGAGLLKGFAITTIIGISAGVLITRPAFTEMVKKIEK